MGYDILERKNAFLASYADRKVRVQHTVEPRYNEPLYKEVLGLTNDFLYLRNSKIYEKEPRYNETLF